MLNGVGRNRQTQESVEKNGKQGGRDYPALVALGLPHQRMAAGDKSVVRGRESV